MESEGTAKRFWQRAEDARLKKGWSVSELADAAGIDRGTYGRLRTGRRAPLPGTVKRVAEVLGIALHEAFELAGLVWTGGAGHETHDEVDDPELVELLARLSPRRRAALERMRQSERDRYRRMREQAREDYARAQREIADVARLEIVRDAEHERDSD